MVVVRGTQLARSSENSKVQYIVGVEVQDSEATGNSKTTKDSWNTEFGAYDIAQIIIEGDIRTKRSRISQEG